MTDTVIDKERDYVVLLHGLGRTKLSMAYAAFRLAAQGFRVLNIGYPSRRMDLEKLAGHVAERISRRASLACRFHYLTHSMGGIVLRTAVTIGAVPEPGRAVMLAPPNQGSRVAQRLERYALFRATLGPSARQLAAGQSSVPASLGPATFELGVITGNRGLNPLLSSMAVNDHDGLVALDEARLEGMSDFLVVPYGHTFIMNRSEVLRQVVWFYQTGKFRHE